ncbi:interleukin-10 receptor subunit beta [Austrofundulus limnaeus]|uniref:Interleukin-10 receptor subunit beta n=1 Tax=Austrofundulus limnaeus TaxID=52670 RepID=A0A2I4CMP4_AUSLI|nr:PREDICTED: interleukin-10 receptor subunit beta-like [Austrofundulus limnaeus]
MLVTLSALILTVSAFIRVVSGVLDGPTNVVLSSKNLDLVLRWDPPNGAPSGLIYTAEFRSSISAYREGCVNISVPQCDLTSFKTSVYGTYIGRVRALLGSESSAWVDSNHIMPDKDTIIGPPNVTVLSHGRTLDVSITDPKFHSSSLRDVYNSASYKVTYWKKGQKDKSEHKEVQQTRVVLSNLEPKSEYCVQVRIVTDHNPSEPSSIICESTTDEESLWVPVVIVFVIMAVAVVLVVLIVMNWRNISQFLCPKEALTQHFKETLLATSRSSVYLAMRNSEPIEEINQVSIVAAERTAEDSPLEDVTVEDREVDKDSQ